MFLHLAKPIHHFSEQPFHGNSTRRHLLQPSIRYDSMREQACHTTQPRHHPTIPPTEPKSNQLPLRRRSGVHSEALRQASLPSGERNPPHEDKRPPPNDLRGDPQRGHSTI